MQAVGCVCLRRECLPAELQAMTEDTKGILGDLGTYVSSLGNP